MQCWEVPYSMLYKLQHAALYDILCYLHIIDHNHAKDADKYSSSALVVHVAKNCIFCVEKCFSQCYSAANFKHSPFNMRFRKRWITLSWQKWIFIIEFYRSSVIDIYHADMVMPTNGFIWMICNTYLNIAWSSKILGMDAGFIVNLHYLSQSNKCIISSFSRLPLGRIRLTGRWRWKCAPFVSPGHGLLWPGLMPLSGRARMDSVWIRGPDSLTRVGIVAGLWT